MKTHFQQFTPLNLSGFFDQWVKEKGFAHFDILWVLKTDDTYQVRIKQTPRFNEVTYRNVVATVTAFSKDFERFDYILAMDRQNLADLRAMCPEDFTGRLDLFANFGADRSITEVPDPYYGGDDGFENVYQMIDSACEVIAKKLN